MRTVFAVSLVLYAVVGCSDNEKAVDPADAKPDVALDSGVDVEKPPPKDVGGDVVDGPKEDIAAPRLEWESIPADLALVDHTATLLADGRVLIVGGFIKPAGSGAVGLKETYLYDPDTNAIVGAGELSLGRGKHTATLLGDGRVLIAGGKITGGTVTDLTEIYDPSKSGQAAWSDGPPLLENRASHAAVLLPSGSVVVIGGYRKEQLDTTERFEGGTWTGLTSTMNNRRADLTATLLESGKVLVVGGWDGQQRVSELEVFDDSSGTWAVAGSLAEGRSLHTSTRLDDGRVLIVGGKCADASCQSSELYDPVSDTLATVIGGKSPSGHAAAKLLDGRVLISGDQYSDDRNEALLYSSAGWKSVPDLLQGRCLHSATLLGDGSVLVVGGQAAIVGHWGPYVGPAERFYP